MLETLNDHYGPTSERDIDTRELCYNMKADREIEVYGVSFEFFFRPQTDEVKVITLALGQRMEFDLEAVFTKYSVVRQIDEYINDSMTVLLQDNESVLTGDRVQNTIGLLRGEYSDLMVYGNNVWNPKTKALERMVH